MVEGGGNEVAVDKVAVTSGAAGELEWGGGGGGGGRGV